MLLSYTSPTPLNLLKKLFVLLFFLLCPLSPVAWAEGPVLLDLEYARVGEQSLALDLFLPDGKPAGLVVYVHGGGWRSGSKLDCPIRGLRNKGLAVASVDYRLSGFAKFPAAVHDIKAAIRFLRTSSEKFGYPSDKIAIAGSSAGGHLAALVGLSEGSPSLEGGIGEHVGVSSRVCGIISFFGASNLNTILAQSTEFGLQMRVPALTLLLGGLPQEKPELTALASPVTHVDAGDPPVLLFHGDADPQMPPQQSEELVDVCKKAGVPVALHVLPGSKHGGSEFYDATRMELVVEFLKQTMDSPRLGAGAP